MTYDIIIKGGTIVDGTGAARFGADLALAHGKIAEIGRVTGERRGNYRRARPDRRARLRRSAHSLRRADLLGPPGNLVVMARRDFGRDG